MARRGLIWLVAAIVLAAAAAAATSRSGAQPARDPLVVAIADLPAGTVFSQETLGDLVVARPDAVDPTVAGIFADPLELIGRTTAAQVIAGEPLTEAAMVGALDDLAPLRAGERAIPVPSSALGAAAAAISPGVRVDVAVSGEEAGQRGAVIAVDAEVLAVANDQEVDLESGGALLRVGTEEALDIIAALDAGRALRLLVRPGADAAGRP